MQIVELVRIIVVEGVVGQCINNLFEVWYIFVMLMWIVVLFEGRQLFFSGIKNVGVVVIYCVEDFDVGFI